MKKIILLFLISLLSYSSFCQTKKYIGIVDTIRYEKLLKTLYNRDNENSPAELKKIVDKPVREDEGYFYFFKGIISFYIWQREDSIHGNGRPYLIDSAATNFARALKINKKIHFNKLYLETPQIGLDTCIAILSSNAKSKYLNKNYLGALNDYEKIIDIKRDYQNIVGAGLSALMVTSYYKSEKYFKEAIDLKPEDYKNWVYIVESYKRRGDTINAIEYAIKSSNKFPNNYTLVLQDYHVNQWAGNRQNMVNAIPKLEKLSNKDAIVYNILGVYYQDYKRYEEAENAYLNSFSLIPEQKQLLFNIIVLYYNRYLSELQIVQSNEVSGTESYILKTKEAEAFLLKSEKFIDNYLNLDDKNILILTVVSELNNVKGDIEKMKYYLDIIEKIKSNTTN